ncbi:MAG: di-trans,poly-cis-decaprenylcistransferase [Spirochaetaceae bacterium]|jgi:undecaprenyl diphosphate synthase|nr:di-trans,poly-cis-decaprenylcistransferase [Spirochaetaceae bacterium]
MKSEKLNEALPCHVGIIMDGNGRWAAKRGITRTGGHTEGLKTARRIVETASNRGIRYLTLFVFSTENWKRAALEVDFIMSLVKQHLVRELDFYRKNNLRIRHTGDVTGLAPDIIAEIDEARADTKDFNGMQVILALNYGGRDAIIRAARRFLLQPLNNSCAEAASALNEDELSRNMDNPDVPDPDLIIRTAGEFRTSNFLLWEAAYAEYFITDKFWPDFSTEDFDAALAAYAARERRFGANAKIGAGRR